MIKKLLFLILIIFSFVDHKAYPSSSTHSFYCSSELEDALATIQKLPQVNELISQIRLEGPLYIEINRELSDEFEGYWNSGARTVYITQSQNTSEGALLCTLLFELHNASRDADFNRLYSRASQCQMNKNAYIEAVEYLEYQNVIATSALFEEGIQKGIFPSNINCFRNIPDFQEHFQIQKNSGHSAWIAKEYDQIMVWAQCSDQKQMQMG